MRKLVSIREIKDILPIKKADRIEIAVVDGWECVVRKDEFKKGDIIAYFEIDSFLPIVPEFEFLEKSSKKKMGDKEGLRLRTVKLRGQISEGLVLHYKELERFFVEANAIDKWKIGEDITEIVNVEKYEPPIPASMAGETRGVFPSFIKQTDQERIQNLFDEYVIEYEDIEFEESLKLDGTSCTYYIADITDIPVKITENMDVQNNAYFGYCSRNLEKIENNDSTPWKIAHENIKEKMHEFHNETGRNFAIQGELMGPKIQGNREKLLKPEFFLFDIWDIDKRRYMSNEERKVIVDYIGVKHVPIIQQKIQIFKKFSNIKELLQYAKGKSINNDIREGIVFKSVEPINGQIISFKAINSDFLLSGGD